MLYNYSMNKILLIGGCLFDYSANSNKTIHDNEFNEGRFNLTIGGVMHNIAVTLAILGIRINFITAIGEDKEGKIIKKELGNYKINFYYNPSPFPSGKYIAINNEANDLEVGLCDNRIFSSINVEYLLKLTNFILEHNYLVIDSNLDENVISYIFKTFKNIKILVEAITPKKVIKFQNYLQHIYLIKCNKYEAEALTTFKSDPYNLVKELLLKGIANVIITNKDQDIYYGSQRGIGSISVKKGEKIVNTMGCGDSLFSGVIYKIMRNKSLKEAIEFGEKLSLLSLESIGAINYKELKKYGNNFSD